MVVYSCALLLMVVALLAVTLYKAYFYLPARELKHRAEHGDAISAALYAVAAYGAEAQLFLSAVLVLATAGGIILFSLLAPAILAFLVVALLLTLGFFWQPRTRLTKFEATLAVWCAPAMVWLISHVRPALSPFVSWAEGRRMYHRHTRLYDAEDVAELLVRQQKQRDNRLNDLEIDRLRRALHFGRRHVSDVLIPRAQVKAVDAADQLSPVLVDELHRTGHMYFPVYEGKAANIVGTLAMERIADVKLQGTIGDNTDRHVAYLHEKDTLEHALRALYETRYHLFIVLDSHGKYAGILTLGDILRELAGEASPRQPFAYDDRDTVLARHKTVAKSTTEVVE